MSDVPRWFPERLGPWCGGLRKLRVPSGWGLPGSGDPEITGPGDHVVGVRVCVVAQPCPPHLLHRLVPRAAGKQWLGSMVGTQRDTDSCH